MSEPAQTAAATATPTATTPAVDETTEMTETDSVKVYTADEVAKHNTRDDCWLILNGKVLDCTAYLDEHPGGEEVILDCAGADGTEAFADIGHSDDAQEIADSLVIGNLKGSAKSGSASTDAAVAAKGDSSNLPLIAALGVLVAVGAYFLLSKK